MRRSTDRCRLIRKPITVYGTGATPRSAPSECSRTLWIYPSTRFPLPPLQWSLLQAPFWKAEPANGAHPCRHLHLSLSGTGECHDGAGGPRHLGRLGVRPSSAMPRRRSPDRALEPARTRSSEGLAGGDVPGRRHRLHASRLSALAIASGEKRRASACERQAVPADVRWGDLRASGSIWLISPWAAGGFEAGQDHLESSRSRGSPGCRPGPRVASGRS